MNSPVTVLVQGGPPIAVLANCPVTALVQGGPRLCCHSKYDSAWVALPGHQIINPDQHFGEARCCTTRSFLRQICHLVAEEINWFPLIDLFISLKLKTSHVYEVLHLRF